MNEIGLADTRFGNTKKAIVALANNAESLGQHEFLGGPVEDFQRVFREKREETRLFVAVCGAYSSGKSTLVSCLTGRDDISIGAGITTDTATPYECDKDWTIVDTPGICAGRPEHDERSLRYMERADLLLYLIPSKGFSPEVEKNFKNTIMARYAGKTMLVMGRISDVEEANLPAKRQDVAEVLGDEALLDTYRFCMVDVKDYMEGKNTGDAELLEASRMEEFKRKLDDFLREKGAYGKCLALLDVLDGFIAGAKEICESQAERDEIARRQRRVISSAMEQYRRTFMDAKARMLEFVRAERTEMLAVFPDKAKEFEKQAETLADRLEEKAHDSVFQNEQEAIFENLSAELNDISEQVEGLNARLSLAFGGNVGGLKGFDMSKWQEGAKQIGNVLATMSKETLIRIVHLFGGKFKPYGAIKWIKILNAAGKAIPIIAEGADRLADHFYEKKIEEGRSEIRNNFSEIEKHVRDFYDGWESTEAYRSLQVAKDKLDQAETERKRTNAEKDDALGELSELKSGTINCRKELEALL